jgi:hypothetical protein
MRKLISSVCSAFALLVPAFASSAIPSPPLVPRHPTGFSTIEQRYAYATPDEGVIEFPLQIGVISRREVLIEEPSMCNGSAVVRFTYSKSANKVVFEALFKGLPYKMSFTREDDPSTPWNQWPTSVHEGKWQIWLAGRVFNKYSTYYYDGTTQDLIHNEFDVAKMGGPPPGATAVSLPVVQMIETPLFEGKPNGDGYQKVEYAYDNMLDPLGSAGVIMTLAPKKLCRPDDVAPVYTNGGLPPSEAMSFDDFIDSINSSYGIILAVSLEPDPKPAYLDARDNIMVGWSTLYPGLEFDGQAYTFDLGTGVFSARETPCGTSRAIAPHPPAYYDFCP